MSRSKSAMGLAPMALAAWVLCLSACARTGTATPRQHVSTAVALFPWPDGLSAASTPRCIALEKQVRDGLALEDDVWSAVTCVVDRLVANHRESDVEKYLSEVRYFESTTMLFVVATRAQAADAGINLPPAAKGDVTLYATPAARAPHPSLAALRTPTLGSGSYRGLCMPWRRKPGFPGHYEVTRRVASALRTRGFVVTDACQELLSDASQDVDLFEWNEMAAHGQTADDKGLPSQSADSAIKRWRDWIEKYTKRAGDLCAAPGDAEHRDGLYLLGYSVHAIEDVASHRGRTNPEHAYNSLFESNPDKVEGVDDLATEMATDVLAAALKRQGKGLRRLARHPAAARLSLSGEDGHVPFLVAGKPGRAPRLRGLGPRFRAPRRRPRVSHAMVRSGGRLAARDVMQGERRVQRHREGRSRCGSLKASRSGSSPSPSLRSHTPTRSPRRCKRWSCSFASIPTDSKISARSGSSSGLA